MGASVAEVKEALPKLIHHHEGSGGGVQAMVREAYQERDRVEYQVENQEMVRGLEVHLVRWTGRTGRTDGPGGPGGPEGPGGRDLEAHLDLEVQQGREVRVEHWDWVDRVVHLGQVVQRVRVVVGQMGRLWWTGNFFSSFASCRCSSGFLGGG